MVKTTLPATEHPVTDFPRSHVRVLVMPPKPAGKPFDWAEDERASSDNAEFIARMEAVQ